MVRRNPDAQHPAPGSAESWPQAWDSCPPLGVMETILEAQQRAGTPTAPSPGEPGSHRDCTPHATHHRSCHPPAPELPLGGPEGPRLGAGAAQERGNEGNPAASSRLVLFPPTPRGDS